MFTSIDADGNGVISREELVSTFQQQAGGHYSKEEVEAIARSVDINDSGKIDFNEFIIAMYDRRKLYLRDSLAEAFEHFDVDHTGFIEVEELREMLKGGDQAEVEYFFSVMDKDSDARISRQEFVEYLLQE
jgi:calcium-dependent protein kinase